MTGPSLPPFSLSLSADWLPSSCTNRTYERSSKPGEYNDLSYYEGRTESQMRAGAEKEAKEAAAAAVAQPSASELDARNPLRSAYRRAPGVGGGSSRAYNEAFMGPR
jgi:hypothetical protein